MRGVIFIRVKTAIECDSLWIEIVGKEEASLRRGKDSKHVDWKEFPIGSS